MISDNSPMGQSINRKINGLHEARLRCIEETKKCFNCGQWGHVIRTCRKPLKQKYPITRKDF